MTRHDTGPKKILRLGVPFSRFLRGNQHFKPRLHTSAPVSQLTSEPSSVFSSDKQKDKKPRCVSEEKMAYKKQKRAQRWGGLSASNKAAASAARRQAPAAERSAVVSGSAAQQLAANKDC